MLSVSDASKRIAAKKGVKGAQEALKFLSLMENVSAALKHDQYGSAQTATELKTFASQLGNPSILQNPKTLLDQIHTRESLVQSDIDSAIGLDAREAYIAQHPEAAGIFGKSEEDTKQTVSDSSTAQYQVLDAQGNDVTQNIPPQYWKASPQKQQEFLNKYGLSTRGH